MKKTNKLIIAGVLILISTSAFAITRSHTTFNGKEYFGPGYTIFEPLGWTKKHGYMGFDIVLGDESKPKDYVPNICVMITAQSRWQGWQKHWNKPTSTIRYKSVLQKNLLKSMRAELVEEFYDTDKFWIMKLKHTQEFSHIRKVEAISLIGFTVQNGDSYMIQCNASEEDYQKYETLFKQVLRSFKLENLSNE